MEQIFTAGVPGRQFSTVSDEISSTGLYAKIFGNSKLKKIQGTIWAMLRPDTEKYFGRAAVGGYGGYGGHLIGTWLQHVKCYLENIEMIQQVKTSLINWKWIFFFITVLISSSCDRTIRLSEADRSWMPYLGNEMLVFRSNSEEMDTIYLIGKDTLWGHPDPLFSLSRYEILSVFSKFKDMYDDGIRYRYLQSTFISIKSTMSAGSELLVDFNAKSATFYRFSHIRIDSLNDMKERTLKIGDRIYKDVYILNGEDDDGFFKKRNDYITKIYWSKSKGVIRYDKQREEFWELVNK